MNIPVVAVLGNHDYEGGHQDEIRADPQRCRRRPSSTAKRPRSTASGSPGVKGFCGGFGRGALGPWGERAVKSFVQEAVDEALKLESALARLRTTRRIAVLHYAPIRATVEGEPPEIFPYLGSGRLEEPINRYRVSAVFHGHAHRGTAEGRTADRRAGLQRRDAAAGAAQSGSPAVPDRGTATRRRGTRFPAAAASPPLAEPVVKTA